MPYLVAVTLLWAVSFSLIGEYLAGQVDSYFAVLTRAMLAGLLFLPLLRLRLLPRPVVPGLLVVSGPGIDWSDEGAPEAAPRTGDGGFPLR